jgi:hypothetical protein
MSYLRKKKLKNTKTTTANENSETHQQLQIHPHSCSSLCRSSFQDCGTVPFCVTKHHKFECFNYLPCMLECASKIMYNTLKVFLHVIFWVQFVYNLMTNRLQYLLILILKREEVTSPFPYHSLSYNVQKFTSFTVVKSEFNSP